MRNVETPLRSSLRYADRKERRRPQREQDVPRSEGQPPKGKGNPPASLTENLLDTADADSERRLTRDG
jgi:hypothetical protein